MSVFCVDSNKEKKNEWELPLENYYGDCYGLYEGFEF